MNGNQRMIALAVAMLLLLTGACAAAEGTLTVQGMGEVYVEADRVSIWFGVREVASDVQTAQAAINEKVASILAALAETGVPENAVSTNGIGIYPNYDYNSVGEVITGYTAYNDLLVTLSQIDLAGTVIDAALAAGANTLNSVEYSAFDTTEAAREALSLAVISARDKARLLADATGMHLDELLEVREGGADSYAQSNALMARTEETADTGASLIPSRQRVSATVQLTYSVSRSTSTRKK